MWKRPENEAPSAQPSYTPPPTAPTPSPSRPQQAARVESSTIGPGLKVDGQISGNEDLVVEGYVEGKIELPTNQVKVGTQGRVKADVHGRVADIAGQVEGNVFAEEQVLVRASGTVRGNLTAPRVLLEDGAKFKGAIDMEPKPVPETRAAAPAKVAPAAAPAPAIGAASSPAPADSATGPEARPADSKTLVTGGARA